MKWPFGNNSRCFICIYCRKKERIRNLAIILRNTNCFIACLRHREMNCTISFKVYQNIIAGFAFVLF